MMHLKRKLIKLGIVLFVIVGLGISYTNYAVSDRRSQDQPMVVNIGYLRVPNDEMIAIANDSISEQLESYGARANFLVFDSGVEANKALASGAIDFASMGITNGIIAMANHLDVELIWVHELLGKNEALVVREGSGILGLDDLKGQNIATTFASTSHYSLAKVLEAQGLSKDVHLLDMKTVEIAAAWQRGDVDAAYTWEPTLSTIVADNGQVLVSSEDLTESGIVTANIMLGRKGFTKQYPEITSAILGAIAKAGDDYRQDPENAAAIVAEALEITPESAIQQMEGTIWLPAETLLSEDYMGKRDQIGNLKTIISEIGQFLVLQREIRKLPEDSEIESFINPSYIEESVRKTGGKK